MGDIESDFKDYEDAKEREGGLHTGRSDPSSHFLLAIGIVVGLLILGGIILSLLG